MAHAAFEPDALPMPDFDIPPRDLIRLVRDALTHLYDHAHLENHPLAAVVDASSGLAQVTRAQRLRRLLIDCIDDIKPQEGAPAAEADRIHAILTYRYVDGLPMDRVAEKRGLGERQAYRGLEKGVQAIAGLLRDRLREQGRDANLLFCAPEATGDQAQSAQAEVTRLRQTAQPEPVDLGDVLHGVLGLLTPLGERTGVHMRISDPGPWPPIIAHRVMLRQALLSLLRSALDAIGQGSLVVGVSPGQGMTCISITAAGRPGATPTPPADRPEVAPAVARALIEAQRGQLEAGWRKGEWWAELCLPSADRATILVVDDNADMVALMQRYLAGHAVNVVGATGAEQALRLAEELGPRLITLDVMMPDQDGWEVLHQLKDAPHTRDIPVVICSVLNEQRLAETMGASDYLTKPISQADLMKVLARWLGPLRPTHRS
jgi:CheY-like chemotaxis protein